MDPHFDWWREICRLLRSFSFSCLTFSPSQWELFDYIDPRCGSLLLILNLHLITWMRPGWSCSSLELLMLVSAAPTRPAPALGDISSELYGDWLWDENFKFCLIFTHFSRFSPFSGYIWWNNTLSSLENFSLNSILFFLFLMSHPDNGGFLKIAQKRDSISKKTSFCIMVINTDHQESWFLSVGHPLCALR